jgi:NAD(P)-dependent dehydrogenase (short-subunit alcohol dehydrogenase family)
MYLEQFKLNGRTAVITGGGRNIGLASAEALAEAGARVVLAEIDEKIGKSGLETLLGLGYDAELMQLDVTDPDGVNAAAAELVERHGKVDVLVCNAGVADLVAAEDYSDADWCRVIDINLNGVFWCCRAFGRHMIEQGGGSIVNIGSMSGFIVNKPQSQCAYNASKAAVHHLTKSLAAEWARYGIRVNAVAPTYINTDLNRFVEDDPKMFDEWMDGTPMRRMGECSEIASVVLFLASEASSLITGSVVLADGGYTCW